MKWREPADRKIVEAVVATFRDSAETSRQRFSALRERDWVRSYYWLDASGLALYLPGQLAVLGIEDSIPAATLTRLEQNLADNRIRVSTMFEEFVAINQVFQAAGVDYANLKGFMLSPESCPDPVLRRALDFDFLVDGGQLDLCREILADHGYVRTAATHKTWEFKAGASEPWSMKNFYKVGPQRSIELHFASASASPQAEPTPSRDERLNRLVMRSLHDVAFPSLSPSEQFISQALHVFGHLCSACTRPSWLLEYRNYVSYYSGDRGFWESVKQWSQGHRHAPVAIGLASALATRLFGAETPRQLDQWTLDCLPPPIRLWAERYGPRTVLGDFPGTKLYLLLLQELKFSDEAAGKQAWKPRHLLPAPRVPRIVYAGHHDSLWVRLGKELRQARYVLFRLRFHAVEGVRYLVEAARWKRQLRILRDVDEHKLHLATRNPSQAKD